MPQTYWLNLFTGTTWEEFLAAGGSTSGFPRRRWKSVQQMRPGDILLCYVTGVSRWIGALEVTGDAYLDDSPIWSIDDFPSRIPVRPLLTLEPEYAVPMSVVLPRLSIYNPERPHAWGGHLRGAPQRMKPDDAHTLMASLKDASANPVAREYDMKKWSRTPKTYESPHGPVTIPDDEEEVSASDETEASIEQVGTLPTSTHEGMQLLLLKLGSGMGLDVWIARNDRNRLGDFADLKSRYRVREDLPTQFDPVTNATIELIDVLWLRRNSVEAAFEIEHTSAIYSGLLRMSDLVAMQPNLNIRLFIVAPEERRVKVLKEIARPTFSRLPRPLHEHCKLLSYADLVHAYEKYADILPHVKPDFLEEIAEAATPR